MEIREDKIVGKHGGEDFKAKQFNRKEKEEEGILSSDLGI